MPTYEYQCSRCGLYFERQQSIHDAPVSVCPECRGTSGGKSAAGAVL
ncbi:MAG TPA: zinc ribbon domain-containing protein [Smithella sp.]|nr:zinc ribbon domain-containing protein [Smithella sp.]